MRSPWTGDGLWLSGIIEVEELTMTLTEREKMLYSYQVFYTKMSGPKFVGYIFTRRKEMPFKPECYGFSGMRHVVVFGMSYEVLR